MSRRMLSAGVEVRKGLTPEQIMAIDEPAMLAARLPTDAEVRDALARCSRELEDMRVSRYTDWDTGEFNFKLVEHPDYALELRGFLIIERVD